MSDHEEMAKRIVADWFKQCSTNIENDDYDTLCQAVAAARGEREGYWLKLYDDQRMADAENYSRMILQRDTEIADLRAKLAERDAEVEKLQAGFDLRGEALDSQAAAAAMFSKDMTLTFTELRAEIADLRAKLACDAFKMSLADLDEEWIAQQRAAAYVRGLERAKEIVNQLGAASDASWKIYSAIAAEIAKAGKP